MPMKNWLIVALIGLAACVAEEELETEAQEVSSPEEIRPLPPGPEWYYTCSNNLLICRAGYGAVEWIAHPSCTPLKRIKCVRGAINP
jgi:hypothetical protein